jgi:protein-S-isoprenylcysteine O-methyltransferase Ste14
MWWKWIAFGITTLILLLVSRNSLRSPRSHGFYRFFAWECMAGLLILNLDRWFDSPFAPWQLVSWILLVISIIPVVWGTLLLNKRGNPAQQRAGDPNLLAFEKTTRLVTTGIYRYIRHPLYCSLLLLGWGIFFKVPSWPGIALAIAATLFLVATARADETECLHFFGREYQDYMQKTKMFIPFTF